MNHHNQRRALRMPVALDQEEAKLRWQDAEYPVRITDQSAGGFGVQVEGEINIQANQQAWLVRGDEASGVRVVNCIDEGSFTRLCLERLDDDSLTEEGVPEASPWSLHDDCAAVPGHNASQVVTGLIVLLGFALAAVAWQWMPRRETVALRAPAVAHDKQAKAAADAEARHRTAKNLQQFTGYWRGAAVSRAIDKSPLPPQARTWTVKQMQVAQGFTNGFMRFLAAAPVGNHKTTAAQRAVTKTATQTVTSAAAAVDRDVVTGNASIASALPRFMDLLSLSDRQRRELDQILSSAHQATADVHARLSTIGTQQAMQEIERIRQDAGDSILRQLSPDQAEKLRSLATSGYRHTPGPAPGEPAK